MNILITAASRRVPLVLAFKSAMRQLGLRGAVIVTDVNPLSPAVYAADRAYSVPLSSDPSYLGELLTICERERIQLAVPTIDDELPLFGGARAQFGALGTLAACSPESTAAICNDKFLTAESLRRAGVEAAATYLPGGIPGNVKFPLFIKPRGGRGSIGAFPIRSAHELEFFLGYVQDPVVQEFLDGPEYTIDVLCGFDGAPLSIVPRERAVIRAGVTDRGRTVSSPALIDLATRVCAALPFGGPLNIQCRMRGDQPVVFEINARFSGGIPLTIAAGADFPAMLLKLAIGHTVEPQIGAFKDGLWITNYDTPLFLDATRLRLSQLRDRRVLHPEWMADEEAIGEVA
jgi:carbamoyl-phosphate synthase large subunit